MTRLAFESTAAVNLSPVFSRLCGARRNQEAAAQSLVEDINQYAITWGRSRCSDSIVEKFELTRAQYDPEREIRSACGSTEA